MLTAGDRTTSLAAFVADRIRARNPVVRAFFEAEAARLTDACAALAARLTRGGRIFAFGRGPYATDAAHVSVEFVHPVIVGKRALPAIDASASFEAMLEALATPDDIAIGFGPPAGDDDVRAALARARGRGMLAFAFPGRCDDDVDYAVIAPSDDPHVHQEIFEILGHTMYESVHVFLEHERRGSDAGAAGFLYPFLGAGAPDEGADRMAVSRSILAKAHDGEVLRETIAEKSSEGIARAAEDIARRVGRGARILTFGNGGSATDATDFALDCVLADGGMLPIPALSLVMEPAMLTAVGNDVGMELTFVRPLVAHARPGDVALAFSTSGGSKNIVAALEAARARGLMTVALLGYDGGEIVRRGLADHAIVVACDYVPRIQETQAAVYHVLREAIDRLRHVA